MASASSSYVLPNISPWLRRDALAHSAKIVDLRVRPAALVAIERIDRTDLFRRELEVEHIDVLGEPFVPARLWDRGHATLDVPTEDHLRSGLAILLGNSANDGIVERVVDGIRVGGPVALDAADRGPALGQHAVLRIGGPHAFLHEVGVQLHLVERRRHFAAFDQAGEMVWIEIAHPDRANSAIGQKLLECSPCRERAFEFPRERKVQKIEIEVVQAELQQAGVERFQRRIVAMIAEEELGSDEQL